MTKPSAVSRAHHPLWVVLTQLMRFAMVGGASNVAYFVIFVSMRSDGAQLANAIGTIASTILANELHRRLTFRAAGRVGWFAAQWAGGGLAFVGLIFSSTAIALLHFAFPAVGDIGAGLVVVSVSAAVGGMRFLALRGWVFADQNLGRATGSPAPAAGLDRFRTDVVGESLFPPGSDARVRLCRRRTSPRAQRISILSASAASHIEYPGLAGRRPRTSATSSP